MRKKHFFGIVSLLVTLLLLIIMRCFEFQSSYSKILVFSLFVVFSLSLLVYYSCIVKNALQIILMTMAYIFLIIVLFFAYFFNEFYTLLFISGILVAMFAGHYSDLKKKADNS